MSANFSIPPASTTLSVRRLEVIERDVSYEFLVELSQIFLGDVEERIRGLTHVVRARDALRVADAAHGVQSAASSMGVLKLRSLAAALERYAEREDWSKADFALASIVTEFSTVRTMLEAMRKAG